MDQNRVTKRSNELTAELCEQMLLEFGDGKDYSLAVSAACTALLFHSFRINLHVSRDHAIEVLRGMFADLTSNLAKNGNIKLTIEVR